MLILTRKIGESINIGNDIVVTVLGVSGQQVRIGIDAPKEVPVHREEVTQRIQASLSKIHASPVSTCFSQVKTQHNEDYLR